MENVQFEEGLGTNSTTRSGSRFGAVSKIFMKLGLAKDQKQANTVMVVLCIIFWLIIAYLLISTYLPGVI